MFCNAKFDFQLLITVQSYVLKNIYFIKINIRLRIFILNVEFYKSPNFFIFANFTNKLHISQKNIVFLYIYV